MKELVRKHKAGQQIGICSVCSAHPLVLEAALRFDLDTNNDVLIEATSNQVNQFGGYTGMKPADFKHPVHTVGKKKALDLTRCTQPIHPDPSTKFCGWIWILHKFTSL